MIDIVSHPEAKRLTANISLWLLSFYRQLQLILIGVYMDKIEQIPYYYTLEHITTSDLNAKKRWWIRAEWLTCIKWAAGTCGRSSLLDSFLDGTELSWFLLVMGAWHGEVCRVQVCRLVLVPRRTLHQAVVHLCRKHCRPLQTQTTVQHYTLLAVCINRRYLAQLSS